MCFVIFTLDLFPFFANIIALVLSLFNKLSFTSFPCALVKYNTNMFFGMPSDISTVELIVFIFCFNDYKMAAPCLNDITRPVFPFMS